MKAAMQCHILGVHLPPQPPGAWWWMETEMLIRDILCILHHVTDNICGKWDFWCYNVSWLQLENTREYWQHRQPQCYPPSAPGQWDHTTTTTTSHVNPIITLWTQNIVSTVCCMLATITTAHSSFLSQPQPPLVSVYEEVPDFTLDLQIPKYEGQENCWK